ncbi:MAG TPA: GIY-YIG nuclease family protein [Candidatus Humimicrobiaceae bacterium]|nr:GIY-YIG nuclease family protein [Candidatus Humimicrobiaceae bacterium]
MENFQYVAKDKISQLSETSGIYVFKKGREFLYIGKAANIRERVKNHFQRPVYRDNFFINQVSRVGYIKTNSEIKALILEAELIKKYQPKYNVVWRDDKNYFYIGITKEPFPRVFITHQPKKISNSQIPISNFIGPFVSGKKLKQALKELRKIYPFRTCKTLLKKPCLWYYLSQCPAPCLFKSRRIEAYDVSNIQGKDATGSMVTFINGKPDKNFYRRFKIKLSSKPNDIAMLKQILSRRLNHLEWGLPDLILIDGGKAQLNAALSLTKIPAIALAKRRNELYMKNLEKPILLKTLSREVFNLILQLRDEAHRFARKYHHKLREIDLFQKL